MPANGLTRTQNGFMTLGSRGYMRAEDWAMREISDTGESYAEITITTPSGETVGKIRSDVQNSIIQSVQFTLDEHGCADFKIVLNALPPFPMFPFSIATIRIGNTRYNWYSGEISYKDDEKADDDPFEFAGVGLRNYLKTLRAQTIYDGGTDISDVVADIVQNWIVPYCPIKYNASKIKAVSGVILANAIELSSAPLETILTTLAQMAGCDWGVDGDKDLYFWPQDVPIKKTFFVGYDVNTFKPKWNLSEVKNAITVQRQEGAGSGGVGWAVAGLYNDPSSVKKYGRKELNYQVPGYFEDEECDIIGNALLAEKKEPAMSANISGYLVRGGNEYLARGNYRFIMPFDEYEFVHDDVDSIDDWETETGTGLTVSLDDDVYMYGAGSMKIEYSGNNSDLITLVKAFKLGKITKINMFVQASKAGSFMIAGIGNGAWNDHTVAVDIVQQDKFINFEWDVSDLNVEDITHFGIQFNDALGTPSTDVWIDRILFTVRGNKSYQMQLKKATYKFAPNEQAASAEFGIIPPKMENYLSGLFATATELKFAQEILYDTGGGGGGGVTPSTKFIEGPDIPVVDGNILIWDGITGEKAKDSGSKPADFAVAAKGVTNGDSHNHVGGDGAAITEAALSLSDNTTGDASTSHHGFVPKLPNDATKYYNGSGAWAVPASLGEIPYGTILMYGAATAPTGYLLCDGAAVSRTTYADLFTAISTTFGTGDGSTTFNVPDMRGVFPKGAGATTRAAGVDASGNAYAATLGAYAQDKMQGHYHRLSGTGSKDGVGVNGTWTDYMMRDGKDDGTYSNNTEVQIPVTDGTNGTPRSGHTTEPQSLGITFIIKY